MIDRNEIAEGRAWAATVLRKAPMPKTIATPAAHSAVDASRRDLASPGAAYTVGAERYAADGTRWQRVA